MNLKALLLTSAKYGAIASVISFIGILTFYYSGKHPLLFPPYLDFRILLFGIFIFFSLKEYRTFVNDGILYFWEGLIGSLTLVTVFSILCSLYIYIFSSVEDNFIKSFVVLFREQAKTFSPEDIKQIGKENFERYLKELPANTTSYTVAKNYFIQSYVISFFISIILSVILRRQPKN
jgi:hypothetical protein